MKALVWMGKNDMRVVETSKPKIIDDHNAIVKITGTAICGSDVDIMHGVIVQMDKGDILGHDFCISCGECEFCKKKLTTACERTNASRLHEKLDGGQMGGIFGYSHFTGGYAGDQAEYVLLYLCDILPTSYHSVANARVKEGGTVAIWGLGPIGLMACVWAFPKGAKRVIAIDNNWRPDFAKSKIGRLETINFSKLKSGETVPTKVHELVPSGVDVSIDATGGEYGKGWAHKLELMVGLEQDTSEIINECIYSTRKFGRVGIISDYVAFINHFNVGALMEYGITLVGCGQSPVQRKLRDMVENRKVDPAIMLTHRFEMDDVANGYHMQERREDGLMKCFVETRFSAPRAEGHRS
ncbi:hypothetical protein GE09DRAFT_1206540 [Coniochaeta sp. 2T2.1]|nr:hypothetical protein GE09DRAFT_1206540 [Coniochaeta sp. 2T2.1]